MLNTANKLWRTVTLPFILTKAFAEGVKEGWNDPETQDVIKDMKANCDAIVKELGAKYDEAVAQRTRKWSKRHRDLDY